MNGMKAAAITFTAVVLGTLLFLIGVGVEALK